MERQLIQQDTDYAAQRSDDANLYDLERDRQINDLKLKTRFEDIFRKYSKDFSNVGDEIDLLTGKIIVNNGHIANMRDEQDIDPGNAGRVLMSFTADAIDDNDADEQDESDSTDESEESDDEARSTSDSSGDLHIENVTVPDEVDPETQSNESPAKDTSQTRISISDSDGDELSFAPGLDPITHDGSNPPSRKRKRTPERTKTTKSHKGKSKKKQKSNPDPQSVAELGQNIAMQIARFMQQHGITTNPLDPLWAVPELPQLSKPVATPLPSISAPVAPRSVPSPNIRVSPLRGATDARQSVWSNDRRHMTGKRRMDVSSYIKMKRKAAAMGTPLQLTANASENIFSHDSATDDPSAATNPLTSDPALPSSPSRAPRTRETAEVNSLNDDRPLKGPGRRRKITFSTEQEDLLIKLRMDDELSWAEILEHFPGYKSWQLQSRFYKMCSKAEKEMEQLDQSRSANENDDEVPDENPNNTSENPLPPLDDNARQISMEPDDIATDLAAPIDHNRLSQDPLARTPSVPPLAERVNAVHISPQIKQESAEPPDNFSQPEEEVVIRYDPLPSRAKKPAKKKTPKQTKTTAKATRGREDVLREEKIAERKAVEALPAIENSDIPVQEQSRNDSDEHIPSAASTPPAAAAKYADSDDELLRDSESDDLLAHDSATDLDPEDELASPPLERATPRPRTKPPTLSTLADLTPRAPPARAPPSTTTKTSAYSYDPLTRHWSKDSTTTVTTVSQAGSAPRAGTPRAAAPASRQPALRPSSSFASPRRTLLGGRGTNYMRERREKEREEIWRRTKRAAVLRSRHGDDDGLGGWSGEEGEDDDDKNLSDDRFEKTGRKTSKLVHGSRSRGMAEESEDELAM